MPLKYICCLCGVESEEPHGCSCGGDVIPSEELAAEDAEWDRMEEQWDQDDLAAEPHPDPQDTPEMAARYREYFGDECYDQSRD